MNFHICSQTRISGLIVHLDPLEIQVLELGQEPQLFRCSGSSIVSNKPKLGRVYKVKKDEEGKLTFTRTRSPNDMDIFEYASTLFIRATAMSPSLSTFSLELQKTQGIQSWSPTLGFLKVPQEMEGIVSMKTEPYVVLAKFDAEAVGGRYFELRDVGNSVPQIENIPMALSIDVQLKRNYGYFGICIKKQALKWLHNGKVPEISDYIYSPKLGVVKSMSNEAELGKWYHFVLNKKAFTAEHMQRTENRVPTHINNEEIQFPIYWQLSLQNIRKPCLFGDLDGYEDHLEQRWEMEHVMDKELGRIRVDEKVKWKVVQKIANYLWQTSNHRVPRSTFRTKMFAVKLIVSPVTFSEPYAIQTFFVANRFESIVDQKPNMLIK